MIFFQFVPAIIASVPPYPASKAGTLGGARSVLSHVTVGPDLWYYPTRQSVRASRSLTSDLAIHRVSVTVAPGNDLRPVTTNRSSSISGTAPIRDIVSGVGRLGSAAA